MVRLLGPAGLLTLISAALALATGHIIFRVLTLVLGVGILLLYWLFYRSLPVRRGELPLQGLREPVEVFTDNRGMPHVYAQNLHDLYMAQGYVTAQDRLWSMDLDRRTASGRLAEVFGEKLLPVDKHLRTLGLRRSAEASLQSYSPEVLEYLEAYAAGVNARIAEGKLPPEFMLMQYSPEPWTPADSVVISKYHAYEHGGNWYEELVHAHLIQAVGAEKAAELLWLPADQECLQTLDSIPLPEIDSLLSIATLLRAGSAGSNGWVISGTRSRSGSPLLANDLHLPSRMPAIWYQSHLVASGGMDVVGVSRPGIPGIMLGHNRDIAWGMADLHPDVQDVFVEQMNPEAPDEVLNQGSWEKARVIREEILVRGQTDPVYHDVMITRHGPVLGRSDHTALTLQWAALNETREIEGFLSINRAQTWADFRQALQQYDAPAQCFLLAGQEGTIAWRVAGQLPIRTKGRAQLPVPGWTGDYEWIGTVPFDELPEAVNPSEGYFIVADNDITPQEYPYHLGSAWSPPYRSQRITERLRGATELTVERLHEVQDDQANLQARTLLPLMLTAVQDGLQQGSHVETLTDTEKQALLMLSGWECNEAPDAPEPVLFHQWYLFLVEGIYRQQMGLTLFNQFIASGVHRAVTDRLIQRVAAGEQSAWLDREGEAGLARTALQSFRRTVAMLAAKQGPKPERWHWGKEHTGRFSHGLVDEMGGLLRLILPSGSYRIGGSNMTVNRHGYSELSPFQVNLTASWRHLVDMGRVEEALDICAPGQSGHPLSQYHHDQIADWLQNQCQTQLYHRETIRQLPRLHLFPRRQDEHH